MIVVGQAETGGIRMQRADAQQKLKTEHGGEVVEQIERLIEKNRGRTGALIRILEQVQVLVGYLPPEVMEFISHKLRVPLSEVYGIVSFYHFFTMVPRGKYTVQVCMGTACYVRGGKDVLDAMCEEFGIEPGGTTSDRRFSLEIVRCLGCCGLSPVMTVGGNVHGKVKARKLIDILNLYE